MKKKKHRAAKSVKIPAFVVRGERAAARVAKKLRMESRLSGLPLVVW